MSDSLLLVLFILYGKLKGDKGLYNTSVYELSECGYEMSSNGFMIYDFVIYDLEYLVSY